MASWTQATQTPGNSNISKFPCSLQGIFISSVTGTATIAIFDSAGTDTASTAVAAFTPIAPSGSMNWYSFGGMQMKNGINVSVAATVVYTIVYD